MRKMQQQHQQQPLPPSVIPKPVTPKAVTPTRQQPPSRTQTLTSKYNFDYGMPTATSSSHHVSACKSPLPESKLSYGALGRTPQQQTSQTPVASSRVRSGDPIVNRRMAQYPAPKMLSHATSPPSGGDTSMQQHHIMQQLLQQQNKASQQHQLLQLLLAQQQQSMQHQTSMNHQASIQQPTVYQQPQYTQGPPQFRQDVMQSLMPQQVPPALIQQLAQMQMLQQQRQDPVLLQHLAMQQQQKAVRNNQMMPVSHSANNLFPTATPQRPPQQPVEYDLNTFRAQQQPVQQDDSQYSFLFEGSSFVAPRFSATLDASVGHHHLSHTAPLQQVLLEKNYSSTKEAIRPALIQSHPESHTSSLNSSKMMMHQGVKAGSGQTPGVVGESESNVLSKQSSASKRTSNPDDRPLPAQQPKREEPPKTKPVPRPKAPPLEAGMVEVDPSIVYFTFSRVRPFFSCGRPVQATLDSIAKGEVQTWDLPSISLLFDGKNYFSLNNRRLFVFKALKDAGMITTVRARVKPVPQTKRMKDKYTVDKCSLTAKLMREGGAGGDDSEHDSQDEDLEQEEVKPVVPQKNKPAPKKGSKQPVVQPQLSEEDDDADWDTNNKGKKKKGGRASKAPSKPQPPQPQKSKPATKRDVSPPQPQPTAETKMAELDKEIELFQQQNKQLQELQKECEAQLARVNREVEEFEARKEQELKEFERYKEQEMNDLEFIRDEVQVEKDQLRIDRDAMDRRMADMQEEQALKVELLVMRIRELEERTVGTEVGIMTSLDMVEVGMETDRNVVMLGSNVRVISIGGGSQSDGEEVSLISFGQRQEQASQLTVTAESQSDCVYASQSPIKVSQSCSPVKQIMSSLRKRRGSTPKEVIDEEDLDSDSEGETYELRLPDPDHPIYDKDCMTEELKAPEGKLMRVYESGRREVLFPNGVRREVWPDGYSVIRFANGDIKQAFPSGARQRIVYYFSDAHTTQTTFPNGLQVFRFENGQVEKHFPDGTKEIAFADGTVKCVFPEEGEEESIFPDGTVQRVSKATGMTTVEHPDGTTETIQQTK